MNGERFVIAQITDTHIKRKGKLLHHMVNTARSLKRAVARLNALEPRPDAVFATGDLTDGGKPREYKRLRKILAELEMPLYVMPGNHDEREAFREAFHDHAYLPRRGPINYALGEFPVRLIALDTTVAGASGGTLDAQRLAWFETCLAQAPGSPTFVFTHHPPFRTGIRLMDGPGFTGASEFGAIVARYPNIERIASGHIHRTMQVRWHGTIACTAPSTAHQIVLELREKVPLGITLEPPGFLLHVWEPGEGTVTHTCVVDRFEAAIAPFARAYR